MYTSIRLAIATAYVFLAAVSVSSSAGADNSLFSGKGASGVMSGTRNFFNMRLEAFEKATQSNSDKVDLPRADFSGYNATESACWFGYGFTDTFEFKVTGLLPNRVTASGTVLVTWYDYCNYPNESSITETVSFTMDLSAIRDQANRNWGSNHSEYGNIKVNRHFDYSYAPAAVNASFISSPTFGTVIVDFGYVTQTREHTVEIMR